MALRFIDGFDHYDDPVDKWSAATGSYPAIITNLLARTGANSLRLRHYHGSATNLGSGVTYGFPVSATRAIIGFALYVPSATTSPATWYNRGMLSFLYGGNGQLQVHWNPDGSLTAARHTTNLGSTGGGVITRDAWNFLEVKARVHDTQGEVEIRVNGTPVLSLSGVDTAYSTGVTEITGIALSGGCNTGGSDYVYLDDLYILDDSGTVNNDFLGDVKVETLLPTADGASSDWTPSAGSDHFALLDEVPPDLADYVETDTPGAVDLFAMSDLSVAAADIKGLQWCMFAKEADAGSRVLRPAMRQGGTTRYGTGVALTTTEAYRVAIQELNPATDAEWTVPEVNADNEFGMELQA